VLAVTLALACSSLAQAALASDTDPWWGRDKALHFGVSAGVSAGTYAVAATQYPARYPALLWGAGVALGLGVGKEVADAAGLGTASWRDLAWDVIGTATGLLIAWTVDLVVRGITPRHPALGASTRVSRVSPVARATP
jgi:putative lipoprotein